MDEGGRSDLAFYEAAFLANVATACQKKRSTEIEGIVNLQSKLVSWLNGDANKGVSHIRTKDVYQTGTKRKVLLFEDIGIKKYEREGVDAGL